VRKLGSSDNVQEVSLRRYVRATSYRSVLCFVVGKAEERESIVPIAGPTANMGLDRLDTQPLGPPTRKPSIIHRTSIRKAFVSGVNFAIFLSTAFDDFVTDLKRLGGQ
jgi:hypothetical protein